MSKPVPEGQTAVPVARTANYDDLIALFREWREFVKPNVGGGIPDYSAAAMKAQYAGLDKWRARLAGIDPSGWIPSRRSDYEIIRAEMNGFEFDHRVLRPWSRDACFYTVVQDSPPDVPSREGPELHGTLLLFAYSFPLPAGDIPVFQAKLQAIPGILEQAKVNLVEDAKDLCFLGIRVKKEESAVFVNLARTLAKHHPDLVGDAERAKNAVDEFRGWLEEKYKTMSAPSGIGIENYNWYMKNVHLVPYTWDEQVALLRRELERAWTFLKLEESRNRNLPPLEIAKNAGEYDKRRRESVRAFMNFLRDGVIFTLPDYLSVSEEPGGFSTGTDPVDFFLQVEYRNSFPLLCHGMHAFDLKRLARETHPIRSVPLLYNIWDSRCEGLATGFEEMAMQAGLMDKNPRARELVYVMLANRAARAMGDLMMHANKFTLDQAVDYACRWTPYDWLRRDRDTVWTDMRIYLHQPFYGASYVIGKAQIDRLIADQTRRLGGKFVLKEFMDEFLAAGLIPMSLIRWEMTGLDDEMKTMGR
jgi:hypothetical protein